MKILIQTTEKGKIEIIDETTGRPITNFGKVDIFISTQGKVSATIEFKDVELKLRVSS